MAKKTAQEALDNQMQKMKKMGITISVNSYSEENAEGSPAVLIADSAKRAGIYEGGK